MHLFRIPDFIKRTHKRFIWNIPSVPKTLFLTFDDGPTFEVTGWILDTLEKYNAKATFFCVGNNVLKLPNIYKKLLNLGHNVGNHTFNHCSGLKMTIKAYIDDIEKASSLIESKLVRPPYGKMRGRQARELIKRGYKIVMWDVLSYDFDNSLSPEIILKKVIKNTQPGSIIVFHDNIKSFGTLKQVLPMYLEHFRNLGYEFKAVSNQ